LLGWFDVGVIDDDGRADRRRLDLLGGEADDAMAAAGTNQTLSTTWP
jgi:hypothetical protein